MFVIYSKCINYLFFEKNITVISLEKKLINLNTNKYYKMSTIIIVIMVQVKIVRHSERLDYSQPTKWFGQFCTKYFYEYLWKDNSSGPYWSDSPLTENGLIMANTKGKQLAAGNFNPKYIYTSPYTRTIDTAKEIQKSFIEAKIVIEPLLSEYQPKYKHLITHYPSGIPTTYDGNDTGFCFPENYEDFNQRIKFIMAKLIEKNNDDILIVTHGEAIKVYAQYVKSIYPELTLELGSTPYLTTLSFDYDKCNQKIIEQSVRIE